MAFKKPNQTVVLNTIAATAGNLDLAGGKMSVLTGVGGSLLADKIKLSDAITYQKVAYAAGTLSVKTVNFGAITLAANTTYQLTIEFPDRKDFPGGGQESNDVYAIRTYEVSSGTSTPTAEDIETLFITRINQDPYKKVTPSSGGSGIMTLTLISLAEGDFNVKNYPSGAVVTDTTPYVAPAGTPAIVEEVAPGKSSATANYTTWKIRYNELKSMNVISGAGVYWPRETWIFADSLATNYAAFETEIDAILAGTHTPVADYLGV